MTTLTSETFGPRAQPPPPRDWPAPLGDAAYIGVLGDIVRDQAPETEADPVGILLTLLVMLGNVVGRTAHFRVGSDTHYLNLFLGIVGRTSKGRKGVGLGLAKRLVRGLDPWWTDHAWAHGLSSGEGLIWAVRDAIEAQHPIKEKGRVVGYETVIEDHGVTDKRLMLIEIEFASVLRRLPREGNSLSAIIREAWDGHSLRSMTKSAPGTATDPHISIVAHITRDELRRYLETTETANGLANRFLWCCVRRQRLLPDGGQPIDIDAFRARLGDVIDWCRLLGRELVFDTDAHALWLREYAPLTADRPGLLGAVTSRAEAQVRRLACLYAVSERCDVIELRHLRAALEVWRYCQQSASAIFGDALGDPMADRLRHALRQKYPESLTRQDITTKVFGGNRTAEEIDRAIDLLIEHHLADQDIDRTGPGRPTSRVWSIEHTPAGTK